MDNTNAIQTHSADTFGLSPDCADCDPPHNCEDCVKKALEDGTADIDKEAKEAYKEGVIDELLGFAYPLLMEKLKEKIKEIKELKEEIEGLKEDKKLLVEAGEKTSALLWSSTEKQKKLKEKVIQVGLDNARMASAISAAAVKEDGWTDKKQGFINEFMERSESWGEYQSFMREYYPEDASDEED